MDEETADIFMASTPPTGWGDVATKQDLATQTQLLTATFAAKLAEEIGGVQKQFAQLHEQFAGVYREIAASRRVDKWQTIRPARGDIGGHVRQRRPAVLVPAAGAAERRSSRRLAVARFAAAPVVLRADS